MAVQSYHYTLLNILKWNLYGQWMYFIFARGYSTYWKNILLPRFGDTVPRWWSEVHYDPGWWRNNLTDRIPNAAFMGRYRGAAKYHLEGWIADKSRGIAKPLVDAVKNTLGSLLHGYTTFSTWIETIRHRVGTYVPWWTTSLVAGLIWLRLRFPEGIRNATLTWSGLWESIKAAVRDWARARFDAAMLWVANSAPWAVTWINTLGAWYSLVAAWVTNFKNNPYGTIAGWLGTAWSVWLGIYSDILTFRNEVWVPFKVTLHDLLADPTGWLYDRIEDELIRRW